MVINRQKRNGIGLRKPVHQNKGSQVNTFATSFLATIAGQETVIGRFSKAVQGF
jgi:hypothetical protein